VKSLVGAGFVAYFAGGCVRDGLLGVEPSDFDVATDATPAEVERLFGRVQMVGASFGVVLVRREGHTVEVATFRSDGPYSDFRRPDSVRYANASQDAHRRDFTINALFLDPLGSQPVPAQANAFETPLGRVIDFVGGQSDLTMGLIRAVGDPDARLREDHLRALRAVRFAARFSFPVDPSTAAAIRRHARDLSGVSRERIGEELRRMLSHPTRADAFRLLIEWSLAQQVFGFEPADGCTAKVQSALPQTASFEVSLAAALIDLGLGDGSETSISGDAFPSGFSLTRSALMLSNEEHARLTQLLRLRPAIRDQWRTMGVAAKKRAAARGTFSDQMVLCQAETPAAAAQVSSDVAALTSDGIGIDPPRLLRGDHLITAGWRPGPTFKNVLEEVFNAQLEGRVATFDEARELANRMRV